MRADDDRLVRRPGPLRDLEFALARVVVDADWQEVSLYMSKNKLGGGEDAGHTSASLLPIGCLGSDILRVSAAKDILQDRKISNPPLFSVQGILKLTKPWP